MENRRAGGVSPATDGLCVPGYVAETASCLPDTRFLSLSLICWGQHVPAQKRKGKPAGSACLAARWPAGRTAVIQRSLWEAPQARGTVAALALLPHLFPPVGPLC